DEALDEEAPADLGVVEDALATDEPGGERDESPVATTAAAGGAEVAGDVEQWDAWDAEFDRDWGPFDIEEVDLDADDTKRLDLGTLVVTPFEKMTMQLQVDKAKEKVQAILVAD